MSPGQPALNLPGRLVLFDYGDVISASMDEATRAALLAAAGPGAEPDTFWRTYWGLREELDQGRLTTEEYWLQIGEANGRRWEAPRLQTLWSIDFSGWMRVEQGTVAVLSELAEAGTRMALLSNAGLDYASAFRHSPICRFFEQAFLSAELRLLKPDPQIFLRCAELLGLDPARIVFVDNKPENVRAARSVGMDGHVFTGPVELRQFLAGLVEQLS